MSIAPQIAINATYMRGGTSKGVFFLEDDLPREPQLRDALLLRVLGSPDRYSQQIDGMGGGSSSTSKVVILRKSTRPGCDVDYLFGQVAVDKPLIDWSGNCGNLSAAVGPFAIFSGLVPPGSGSHATIRIWQRNIEQVIVSRVPLVSGQVQETGDFHLDGVTFAAAEIELDFIGGAGTGSLFPTGRVLDNLDVPGVGLIEATLLTAGNPAVFIDASVLGLHATELQKDVNSNTQLLAKLEQIRAQAAVAMGMVETTEQASAHMPSTPKIAFFAAPQSYTASDGAQVLASSVDICARILSMGKLHHAMTGTGAIGIAVAAAIADTVVSRILGGPVQSLTFGHPSGSLRVGASTRKTADGWQLDCVSMSRSARRLMTGQVWVPGDVAPAQVR